MRCKPLTNVTLIPTAGVTVFFHRSEALLTRADTSDSINHDEIEPIFFKALGLVTTTTGMGARMLVLSTALPRYHLPSFSFVWEPMIIRSASFSAAYFIETKI